MRADELDFIHKILQSFVMKKVQFVSHITFLKGEYNVHFSVGSIVFTCIGLL